MEDHNITFVGTTPGPIVPPGGSATYSTSLTKLGSVTYQCDVGNHAASGMLGSATITA